MKSLVVIGIMFCSLGLFAQQASSECCPKKDQVCVVDRCCDQDKSSDMKLAPIRKVDARQTSVRCGKSKIANRAEMKDARMAAPLIRKNAQVVEKM